MSTKKTQPRAKARKPKGIMTHGVLLTPELHKEYLAEYTAHTHKWDSETCLNNVLYRHRPSVKASERFGTMDLYQRLMPAVMVLASLREFPFRDKNALVRDHGNGLIGHVADELRAVEQQLRVIHADIARENAEAQP